ncbi:protein-L-isoaspartate O-methyltransferase [Alsobacter sp. SYSU M60028]|uniref:Protein-L-isoaspartate O-methyltransferase n=1 Tax=Alsobacter ponti TaxID=2962936 RepID=A0ABT1LAS2_9HYPH|nr:protein-L-isoaspartate O-methyltransferase [Alsobacter ponti]MCP8938577.1 protein-L-isoaspartate O-methyltransferase [Alsobacter ponti]
MPDFATQRRTMVDGQLRTYDVFNTAVIDAVLDTPREIFVAPSDRAVAYIDRELPVAEGHARRMLTPMVFARLIQSAEILPTDSVLDVGCGSGYGAAVLARIGGSVVALEEDDVLANLARRNLSQLGLPNAQVVTGSLVAGYPALGSYDVIVVEGALEVEPEALLAQLNPGGRLVAVWGVGRSGRASVWTKSGPTVGRRTVFDAAAPRLAAFAKPEAFAF